MTWAGSGVSANRSSMLSSPPEQVAVAVRFLIRTKGNPERDARDVGATNGVSPRGPVTVVLVLVRPGRRQPIPVVLDADVMESAAVNFVVASLGCDVRGRHVECDGARVAVVAAVTPERVNLMSDDRHCDHPR